jgi:hypothetical protein
LNRLRGNQDGHGEGLDMTWWWRGRGEMAS